MSETETRRRIRAMASPRDRQVMRFVLDQAVGDGRKASFAPPAGDAPLARALFAIDGVMKFETADETILVTIAPDRDWQTLKAPVAAAIRAALDSGSEPLGPKPRAPAANDDDAALLAAVSDLLETRANPSIASHGGRITAEAAAASVPSVPFASQMRNSCLDTPRSISGWRGTSWIAARSRSAKHRSTWLVMCSTGLPAVSASACAPAALPAAVPVEVMQTPSPPVTRAWASAMFIAPASPRAGTKRIRPCRAMASRIGMLWIEITPKAVVTPISAR